MKVRNGFITNSSSSSYVIVFAKVTDSEKANDFIKKFNLEKYIYSKETISKFPKEEFEIEWSGISLLDDFNIKTLLNESEWNDLFILWKTFEDYYCIDSSGDIDYDDFDLQDLSLKAQNIYNGISENNGFKIIAESYGAGYNG